MRKLVCVVVCTFCFHLWKILAFLFILSLMHSAKDRWCTKGSEQDRVERMRASDSRVITTCSPGRRS